MVEGPVRYEILQTLKDKIKGDEGNKTAEFKENSDHNDREARRRGLLTAAVVSRSKWRGIRAWRFLPTANAEHHVDVAR